VIIPPLVFPAKAYSVLKNALKQISQTFVKKYGGKCKSAQLKDNLQVLTVI
jgi:hypothetical protein